MGYDPSAGNYLCICINLIILYKKLAIGQKYYPDFWLIVRIIRDCFPSTKSSIFNETGCHISELPTMQYIYLRIGENERGTKIFWKISYCCQLLHARTELHG